VTAISDPMKKCTVWKTADAWLA